MLGRKEQEELKKALNESRKIRLIRSVKDGSPYPRGLNCTFHITQVAPLYAALAEDKAISFNQVSEYNAKRGTFTVDVSGTERVPFSKAHMKSIKTGKPMEMQNKYVIKRTYQIITGK